MALFGEKYGDEVRVLGMGRTSEGGRNFSVELCGGTHVNATGDIGVFRIVSDSAVSSGVRRIEALTGEGARQWLVGREEVLKGVAASLRTSPEEVEARVAALVEERKRLERELAVARKTIALTANSLETGRPDVGEATLFTGPEKVGDTYFTPLELQGFDPKELRGLVDEKKKAMGSGVAVIVTTVDGRGTIAVGVTDDLTTRFSAVDLVRAGVEALGGKGGGGRPDMAQGGGPDGAKAAEAIAAVRAVLASETAS